jgi:hypothetical protein
MKGDRETAETDMAIMLIGAVIVAVAILSLGNDIDYPPSDPRSELATSLLITGIGIVIGITAIVAGAIRLWQRRNRSR